MKFQHMATKATRPIKPQEASHALTSRDEQVCLLLYQHRCMKTEQIAECVFKYNEGRVNTHALRIAQRRLKWLYEEGYVTRFHYVVEKGSSGYYYVLDNKGIDLVARLLDVPRNTLHKKRVIHQRSVAYLDHSAQVCEVYIRFLQTQRLHDGHEIDVYKGEQDLLHQFTYQYEQHRFNPDAYIRYFTETEGVHCFFELDKGTDNPKNLIKKIARYHAFFLSGAYQSQYETFPLVCFIVPTEKRKQKLMALVRTHDHSPIQWCFTTKEAFLLCPLSNWTNKEGNTMDFVFTAETR